MSNTALNPSAEAVKAVEDAFKAALLSAGQSILASHLSNADHSMTQAGSVALEKFKKSWKSSLNIDLYKKYGWNQINAVLKQLELRAEY